MDSAPRGECHRPISGLLEVVKCRTDTILGASDPENLDILLFLLIFYNSYDHISMLRRS